MSTKLNFGKYIEQRVSNQLDILLVTASFESVSLITAYSQNDHGVKLDDTSHYPLGLAYLHSYLESKGRSVRTLWLNNYDEEFCVSRVIDSICECRPLVIGFQMLTPNRVCTYRLIERIHKQFPEILVVAGGIHATLMYNQLLNRFEYLYIVMGEGELTLSELLDHVINGKFDFSHIDGLAYVANGKVTVTNRRCLIGNLDSLPFPKHSLFFTENRLSGCIQTSRGCPFKCSFCCLDAISHGKVRFRSVENVVDEIEFMVKSFPAMKNIWIHDDTFFLDTDRVIKFCDEIIKRNISIEFICSGRAKPLTAEMVDKLEQANFTNVLIGLESGDEGILARCNKNISRSDVVNAFNLFSTSRIRLMAFLIVGLPGETRETILNTAKFIKKLQKIKYVDYDNVAVLTVYPGTEVYRLCVSSGYLDDGYWLSDLPTPLYTLENSADQLFAYKNLLLEHISYRKLFSINGLLFQFDMLPRIFGHIIRYDIRYLMSLAVNKILNLLFSAIGRS